MLIISLMVIQSENVSRVCDWTVSGLHWATSNGELWDMKFNDCTLEGLVWMQALETCNTPFGHGTKSCNNQNGRSDQDLAHTPVFPLSSKQSLEPKFHLWEIKRILCIALLILIVDT